MSETLIYLQHVRLLIYMNSILNKFSFFSLILSYSTDINDINRSMFDIFQTFEAIVEHGIQQRTRNAGHLRSLVDLMRDSIRKSLAVTRDTADQALHRVSCGRRLGRGTNGVETVAEPWAPSGLLGVVSVVSQRGTERLIQGSLSPSYARPSPSPTATIHIFSPPGSPMGSQSTRSSSSSAQTSSPSSPSCSFEASTMSSPSGSFRRGEDTVSTSTGSPESYSSSRRSEASTCFDDDQEEEEEEGEVPMSSSAESPSSSHSPSPSCSSVEGEDTMSSTTSEELGSQSYPSPHPSESLLYDGNRSTPVHPESPPAPCTPRQFSEENKNSTPAVPHSSHSSPRSSSSSSSPDIGYQAWDPIWSYHRMIAGCPSPFSDPPTPPLEKTSADATSSVIDAAAAAAVTSSTTAAATALAYTDTNTEENDINSLPKRIQKALKK